MGLRETNAARTRELISDTALRLFAADGFDATTMEQVAEAAGVGTSTLYRYFPTKEQLVVEPLAIRGQMAAAVAARPVDEPLDVVLGHAVRALLVSPRADHGRVRLARDLAERVPTVGARMLEAFHAERTLLEQAIAARLGRPADDAFCVLTARLATVLLEMVADRVWTAPDDADLETLTVTALAGLLEQVAAEPPVLPRLS